MASRYFVTGSGGNNNWGQAGAGSNWSLTDGGAGGQAVPLATDDVFFTANSPNCTVDASNRVALSLIFTGYTNTITMTFGITVSGGVTIPNTMTIAGTGFLNINGTGTLNVAGGVAWPNAMTISGTITVTLSRTTVIAGLVTLGGTTLTTTINGSGNILNCQGGITQGGTTSTVTGDATVFLSGGTLTPTNNASSHFKLGLTFAGNATVAAGIFSFDIGQLSYSSGTVTVNSSSTLSVSLSATLQCAGIVWSNVSLIGNGAITLTQDLNVTGTLTMGSGTSTMTINGSNIYASGGLTQGGTTAVVIGTTVLNLIGSGTLSGGSITTGSWQLSMIINTSGTYVTTNGGKFNFGGNTLTYTAGTFTVVGAHTLNIPVASSTTLDTDLIAWYNVTITGASGSITLTSDLNVAGLLTIGTSTSVTTVNGADVNCSGGLKCNFTSGSIANGTSTFNILNTGTIDANSQTTGAFLAKMNINAPGKTITFAITGGIELRMVPTRLMYTAGTVVTTSGTWKRGSSSSTFGQ